MGVLLFWLYIVAVLRRGIAVYRRAGKTPMELAGIAFFAAFLALTGDTFVHAWTFSPGSSVAIVYWLVGAAVVRVHTLTVDADAEAAAEEAEEEHSEPTLELVS